jgi:hypothetical protein
VASSKGLKESQDGARCGRGGRRPLPVADNVGVADPARRGPQRKRQGAGRLRERAMNYDVRAELGTGQAGKLNTALDGAAGPWGSSPDDWVTAIRRGASVVEVMDLRPCPFASNTTSALSAEQRPC